MFVKLQISSKGKALLEKVKGKAFQKEGTEIIEGIKDGNNMFYTSTFQKFGTY